MARKPNIVFFICDDISDDDLGFYRGLVHTPNVDRLAADGVHLTNCFCCSAFCVPSRWEYLTGQYGPRCRSQSFERDNPPGDVARVVGSTFIDGTTPTIAHRLGAAGYRTGYFGKWHTGPAFRQMMTTPVAEDADPADPADPAVDRELKAIQDRMVAYVRDNAGFDTAAAITSGNRGSCPVRALNRYHNPEWATDAALRFLDECGRDQPFYLHLAMTLPHGDTPEEEIDHDPRFTMGGMLDRPPFGSEKRATLRARLAEQGIDRRRALAMLMIDDQLGAVLDRLEELGVSDETIVMFTSDHGLDPGKGSVFHNGVAIPAVIRWPGVAAPGSTVDALAQNVDSCATFLAAAGAAAPEGETIDGRDLRPVLSGDVKSVREDLYLSLGFTRAVFDGRYKYVALRYRRDAIERMQSPEAVEAVNYMDRPNDGQAAVVAECYPSALDPDQLYDLERDPYEQRNLIADPAFEQTARRLRARLQEYVDDVERRPFPLEPPEFMASERYARLAAATRERGARDVPWWTPRPFPPG